MKISKASVGIESDNRLNMRMNITKVDAERRLVHGFATLDNIDRQDDRVTAEASLNAFSKFAGNIREMHQPIAAGRMVAFRPEQFYDVETDKVYNGVFVSARVSKGAESTWQKVLDGTLSAFSIHGPIRDYEMEYSSETGKAVRVVTAYELDELSLVDAGGNQLANIASIEKMADGSSSLKGDIMATSSTNVFWCEEDEVAKTSTEETLECPHGHSMKNVGWFEYADTDESVEKMRTVVSNYLDNLSKNEGGVSMAKENENVSENVTEEEVVSKDVVEEAPVEEETAAEETSEVTEEEAPSEEEAKVGEEEVAAEVSETEEEDISKMLGGLREDFNAELEKRDGTLAEAVETISTLSKSLESTVAKIEELNSKYDGLSEKIESAKGKLSEVEKSLGDLDSATALRKSGELGGSSDAGDVVQKNKKTSFWGNTFLAADDLDD